MSRLLVALALVLTVCASAHAAFTIATGGKPRCVIVRQPGLTVTESNAVYELAISLQKVTSNSVPIQGLPALPVGESFSAGLLPKHCIIVGPGPAARALFPDVALEHLGPEEFVIRSEHGHLLLAGGRPRGTFYAVCRFLQDQCGVRWWTPWAASFPSRPTLRLPELNLRCRPAFEYRAPYWSAAFDPLWKARNGANGESSPIPEELGGCVQYKGFCHTFYPLVPPDKYFAVHPEWYSLINGQRTHERAQLCLSNPELRDFVVRRVKEWLRDSPQAQIVSVTQNDWHGACECPNCKAIDDAEGSPAGSMLAFVNYIAEKIEPEFPNVAVDTFAYLYTRHPPRSIRPRHNVIVRLCSIECNFRESLGGPANAAFLADLAGWAKICSRLYVWDYVTEFGHYVQPHPNWFTLGPNLRLFQRCGVRGVFEEGAYAGPGAEMAELRAWVLAQLMWNPKQDDRALIREFLGGYYGAESAVYIERYLDLLYRGSQGFDLGCYLRKEPPYLHFKTLSEAERLWQLAKAAASRHEAVKAAGVQVVPRSSLASSRGEGRGAEVPSDGSNDFLTRVRLAHLPVRFALLSRWQALRRECWEQNGVWPWPESRRTAADEFRATCQGVPGTDWTHVRALNEKGLSVDDFLKPFAVDPPDTNGPVPPKRLLRPAAPTDIPGLHRGSFIDLQDNLAGLYKPGGFADIGPDLAASDLRAVWMPGSHAEWAFRISGAALPEAARHGRWRVYAVVRVETSPDAIPGALAFTAGVYDTKTKAYPANFKALVRDVSSEYRSYLVGSVETNPDRDIWVAPPANSSVRALYIDRILLVRAPNP